HAVRAKRPALQETRVPADLRHERHLVHGEPARMPDVVRARSRLAPVAFFPVVLADDGAAALEDPRAVAVQVNLVEAVEVREPVGGGAGNALADSVVPKAAVGVAQAVVIVAF
ncbi:MAG: hypothetical protein Q9191_004563, partial [Dirinaria sp. TL-2023a]